MRCPDPLLHVSEKVLQRALPPVAYYACTERLYRSLRPTQAGRLFGPKLNAYAVEWVETRSIRRWSQRRSSLPPWDPAHFGTVQGGDWDTPKPPLGSRPWGHLFGNVIEEWIFFRSMREHFQESVPWTDTQFIQEMLRLAEKGDLPWNSYRDAARIEATCAALDRLYEDIRTGGIKPFRQLMVRDGVKGDLLRVMRGEIILDIARDGQPLLVDGRHRVVIAKLLGVPRVPATIAVRHSAAA